MASGVAMNKFPDEIEQLHRREIQHPSDEVLSFHFNNWDQNLGYGIKFDEVELNSPGPLIPVPGKRFYAKPQNVLDFMD